MKNVIFGKARMKYVTVLLIGFTSVHLGGGVSLLHVTGSRLRAQSATARKAVGPVRAEGRAVADAAGTFNARGATLFWGAWA